MQCCFLAEAMFNNRRETAHGERESARAHARERDVEERERQGETILITQLHRKMMLGFAAGESSFTEMLKLWALVRHMRIDYAHIVVHMGLFCVHIRLFWVFWDLALHNRALAHSHKQPHCVLQCVAVCCSVRNKVLLYALVGRYNGVYRCRVLQCVATRRSLLPCVTVYCSGTHSIFTRTTRHEN